MQRQGTGSTVTLRRSLLRDHDRRGCYSFADILDLAAHHLVCTGDAVEVQARLRSGAVTVRTFLRERYGVDTGGGCDKNDLRRFRLWLSDARWRLRAEEKRQECFRRVTAWNARPPAMVR